MNYYTSILTQIKTAASHSEVATIAGVTSATWATSHVFSDGRKFIQGQNRGRVPFVNIWRSASDYLIDIAASNGGTLKSRWNIEVVVSKYDEAMAYAIAQHIIKLIRVTEPLGSQTIGVAETHPFGISLICDIEIENSHSDSDK